MSNEKYVAWVNLLSAVLCAAIVAYAGNIINNNIQKQKLELQKMTEFGQYIEYALSSNIATRRNLANYFISVTQDDELRRRWESFLSLVENEYARIENEKEQTEKLLEKKNLKDDVRKKLEIRIQEIEKDLKVRPTISTSLKPIPEIFGRQLIRPEALRVKPMNAGSIGR